MNLVTLDRKGKTIVIYVREGYFQKVPDLEFIQDIQIFEDKPSKNPTQQEDS